MSGRRENLSSCLASTLGWSQPEVDEVLSAIQSVANDPAALADIVEGVLGDAPGVRAAVQSFASDVRGEGQALGGAVARQKRDVAEDVFGGSARRHRSAAAPAPAADRKSAVGSKQLTLVEGKGGKKGGAAASAAAPPRDADLRQLVVKVLNCLSCGKVYDCRNATNDNIAMVAAGKCTFCGAAVDVRFSSGRRVGGQHAAPAVDASEDPAPQRPPAVAAEDAEATRRALEFKNRLVEFDRNSAKRTAVIDDQSDFFEVDTNAWLSEEERQQMKERLQCEQEAAEARKNKVVFTIDLLGRQVLMADRGSSDQELSIVLDDRAESSAAHGRARRDALIAAERTASERPQGGGTGAASALAAATGVGSLRSLHVAPNCDSALPAPVFMRKAVDGRVESGKAAGARGPRRSEDRQPKSVQHSSEAATAVARKSAWASRSRAVARGVQVMQEDIFDRFASDTQVLFADPLEAELAAVSLGSREASGPTGRAG